MNGTLEITTLIGCPIRCRYCPQAVLLNAYHGPRRMSLETFLECVSCVPASVRIDFSGMAEPWLNPDCGAMLRAAASRGHPLALFTTLLGMSPSDLDSLAELTIDPFVLHLPDGEGNSRIPITPKYVALIRRFLDLLPQVEGWRHVRISCHGMLHPRLASEFGERVAQLRVPVVGQLIDRAGFLQDADLRHCYVDGRITCRTAGRRLNHNVLLPDGSVTLCCMDYGCEHVLGNLLRQSYESLFAGAEMRSVLAGLDDPTVPLVCRCCERAVPLADDDTSHAS